MSETHTIFMFEDDSSLAAEIIEYLQRPPISFNEPNLVVEYYDKAVDALNAIDASDAASGPAAALLDVHQENFTEAGLDICSKIKNIWPKVPVVFLSDFATVRDQNRGYKGGATIYLSKTLLDDSDFKELLRTILLRQIEIRRVDDEFEPVAYVTGSLKIYSDNAKVFWRDKRVPLTNMDFGILDDLARPSNCLKTRTYKYLGAAAGMALLERGATRNNVRKRIQIIREVFAAVDADFTAGWLEKRCGILTVVGKGYRWVPDK